MLSPSSSEARVYTVLYLSVSCSRLLYVSKGRIFLGLPLVAGRGPLDEEQLL